MMWRAATDKPQPQRGCCVQVSVGEPRGLGGVGLGWWGGSGTQTWTLQEECRTQEPRDRQRWKLPDKGGCFGKGRLTRAVGGRADGGIHRDEMRNEAQAPWHKHR